MYSTPYDHSKKHYKVKSPGGEVHPRWLLDYKDPQTGKEVDEESAISQPGETVLEDTVLRQNKDV